MLAMLILPIGLGWLAQARSKSQLAWNHVRAIETLSMTGRIDRSEGHWLLRKLGIDLPPEQTEIHVCLMDSQEEMQSKLLMHLQVFPHLRQLTIAQPYRSASALQPIEYFQELESLSLDYGGGDEKDEDLALFLKLPRLKQWSDDQPRSLAKCQATFSKMETLQELSLCGSWSGIDWNRFKGLRFLSIRNEDFTSKNTYDRYDEDFATISALLNLEELELSDLPISDEGVKGIAQLTKLRRLVLASDQVTDAGLATLAGMPSLQTLELDSNQVTQEAVNQWKTKRPGLTIKSW